MKEIKWTLYTLYVAGYTSLVWATVIWDGIKVGPNNILLGAISLTFLTVLNIVIIGSYLHINWDED